ncbi:GMC family oxidoreductase [Kineosporia sp. NBRC 101731]|uniref:GMC family oxidoreductase n=1 Tax=Kineosporia sp. NBRC 101731 TaxID=3032199 RepID=UPI0024A449D3|nr:GMC family oxidoreductase [Kineosporia sp. NBRC 101731]GLY29228.1 dehydrogenase [Kineosporia sp. NBRC 101731]
MSDNGTPDRPDADVVIVGGGVNGALLAKRLTQEGVTVLVLEAGRGSAWEYESYHQHLETFFTATSKNVESPWPATVGAPQPDTADVRLADGYFVQDGPDRFGSSYSRTLGGSTLHWLGVCLRMLPEDFALRTRHGVGRDWPIGYDDLEPFYREAEFELGVAADVAEQAHLGITFADGYDFPMQRLPPSYSDQILAKSVDGLAIRLGQASYSLKVRGYPAARNSLPRAGYRPAGAVGEPGEELSLHRGLGQRCQGNTSCTPICPVQAKYNAQKSLAQADRRRLEIRTQSVVSKVLVDPVNGAVTGLEYQHYDEPDSSRHTVHTATGRIYVLAAHAVENAKIMLASHLGGTGIGQGLMDHPALYAWGLSPVPVGAFRGPQSTAGIDDLRGGDFRAQHAAFRFDIGNDGWRATTGAPDSDVATAVRQGLYGDALREHLQQTLPRQVRFSVAVEQLHDPANTVTLDTGHPDQLGNPRPVIRYSIDDYTRAGMAAGRQVYRQMFARAGIEDHSQDEGGAWFPSVTYQGEEYHYHGMGHFAGTHVMGSHAGDSVVDDTQRSWAHPNLFVVGSGSFPTMGTSNPTLTMAALTLRTAGHVLATLRD